MGRTILSASASLVVGAGSSYLLVPAQEPRYASVRQDSDSGGAPMVLHEPSAKAAGTELTLASFLDGPFRVGERAAVYGIVASAGLDNLTAMARELWAADRSLSADFMLDVVFSRMTEIDGNAGINLIREANPAAEQRVAAALAILASRGVTEANIDSILAALPELDERVFKGEAFERLARTDPNQATAAAARLLDEARSSPLSEGGADVSLAIREMARTDPRRALELVDQLKGETREIGLTAAIQAWGSEDPYGALGLVERLGPGRDRDILLQTIGEELGRQDPDGALAWFNALDSSPQGLYGSILHGIAEKEPGRALELALDSADPSATGAVMFLTSTAVQSGDVSFTELAERVLAAENRPSREAGVQMLVNAWADDDPEAALSWLVSQSENVGHSALDQAALAVAWKNPDAAARYTQLLPAEYQDGWIRAVALGYAQTDPSGATAWVEQFRGQAVYDAGMTAIAQVSAMRDPAAAAAMLPSFADTAARDQAATAIAKQWAARQPRAARNWANTLPAGPVRDAALTGMMMVSDELPDPGTLASFQSDQARQQAILNVAIRRATADVDGARVIVERHIDDPALRRQAEQVFENIRPFPG
jgi:hypothetical protein